MRRQTGSSTFPRSLHGWRRWSALLLILPLLNFVLVQAQPELPAMASAQVSAEHACCCSEEGPGVDKSAGSCCCEGPGSEIQACADPAGPTFPVHVDDPTRPAPDGCCAQSKTSCTCGPAVSLLVACLIQGTRLPQPRTQLRVTLPEQLPHLDGSPAPPDRPPQA
jgi:hypothetical protein